MNIRIAEPCGFCFGAKRIVEIAESNGKAYSLGPVLHNEQLIERLRQKGVEPLSLDEILKKKQGRVIIRAHGVTADEFNQLKEAGFEIIDGTCPKVKDVYCEASGYEQGGYKIFIFGDKGHPEVIGIISRLQNPIIIGDIEDIPNKHYDKVCLVSQTTQIPSDYEQIKKAFEGKCNKLKAIDTICSATQERQDAASALAKEVGVMLVIGGKKSSNTRKLYSLCREVNCNTYLIQTKNDLQKEWFDGMHYVGITAGASTPDFIIDSVVQELEKY
ncbi:4-hydroxy-3-methylbut-2-enyl diphosphate reductase [Candidatus Woesearchaeota archaeon]|nr:4-hydroxy-3-methylbut-2-enyl diphosphate reductase [Candidatus Woesearchaeota archaeon]